MKYNLFLLLLLTVLFSCRKDEIDIFEGPDLNDVYGEFTVITSLESSQPNVDFADGQTVYFTCELSKVIDWQLTITGQTSGAEKLISGTSKYVDTNTSTWDGSTTNFPMFKSEVCNVMLTFNGESDTLNTSVTVDLPKVNEGFVIADFETGWNSGWTTFIQSGAGMDFNIKTDASAPNENSYYNMQGLVDWDWLTGLVDFNATAYGSTTIPLSDNGDNLYFNAIVYGDPGLPNSRVLFRFDEDENEDGSFNVSNEDQFGYEIIIQWEGWKLITVKYSDMVGSGGGGNIHNPDKLNKVSVLHLADPASGMAKSGIDYLIFTENAPLQP
ncbi:MAG: hypothetical protein O3A22_02505 [Bacteroidetes bacterium]|jgi:hypothetical protein|nr:hypothetical protein [Bacteroidota bacterium]